MTPLIVMLGGAVGIILLFVGAETLYIRHDVKKRMVMGKEEKDESATSSAG